MNPKLTKAIEDDDIRIRDDDPGDDTECFFSSFIWGIFGLFGFRDWLISISDLGIEVSFLS